MKTKRSKPVQWMPSSSRPARATTRNPGTRTAQEAKENAMKTKSQIRAGAVDAVKLPPRKSYNP